MLSDCSLLVYLCPLCLCCWDVDCYLYTVTGAAWGSLLLNEPIWSIKITTSQRKSSACTRTSDVLVAGLRRLLIISCRYGSGLLQPTEWGIVYIRCVCNIVCNHVYLSATFQGVTDFAFKHYRNPTIFPHSNPLDVRRQFLVEFDIVNCFKCLACKKARYVKK